MNLRQTIACALAAAAVCACFPRGAAAQDAAGEAAKPVEADPAMTEELEFIKALVDANMPDFSEGVIAEAKKKWPMAMPKLRVLELQGALRLGKFNEVQKTVDDLKGKKGHESEYWALRLSMADAYYARGMMPECRKIYDEFFKTVKKPEADLLDFYVESGFKWANICVREKQFDNAVAIYGSLLALGQKNFGKDSVVKWCSVALEAVELLLRLADDIPADPKDKQAKKRAEYLAKAEGYVKELLWKTDLIIVFGKAVAMKAHIEMLRGKTAEAQALVNRYMPKLSEIHEDLVRQDPDGKNGYLRSSPMPECRYMLAKLLWNAVLAESKKAKPNEDMIKDALFGERVKGGRGRSGLGAFNHAINVFAKYPESSWAVDAGELTEKISEFVKKRYNKDIKTNITAKQRENVLNMQVGTAYELYRGQEYAKAADAYKDLVARMGETKEAVNARGVLAECYVNLRQDAKKGSKEQEEYAKQAKETEDFLATQYKGKGEDLVRAAGDCTLRLAAKENDLGDRARAHELYGAYFANYPDHYNAAQTANVLASQAFASEDWNTAARYFSVIVDKYSKSPLYADSLQFLSTCYDKLGNRELKEKYLRMFIGVTKKAGARTTAQLNLALLQQRRGFDAFDAAAETNDTEAAEAMRKNAYREVGGAIRDFRATGDEVAKVLAEDGKAMLKEDREQYERRHAQALFLEGACWQRMTWPEAKIPAFREQAIKAYEKYLASYPKGEYAPQALVKIATIYTAEKNMEKSQETFARLQKDFPESDEAKNSVPRLASTLIEMGLNAEGVATYKKMLETPGGKYSAYQFLQAGDALLTAKSWTVAEEAYSRAIELAKPLTNSVVYIAPASIGQAKALFGAKNYASARQKLDEFVEKFGKSSLVVDAYEMLIEVSSQEGSKEKDDTLRMNSFNTAVRAVKKLRNYRKGSKIALDELDLRSGEILLRKMAAEADMNLQEQLKITRGKAIVAFQAFLMAHEPNESHPASAMTPAELEHLERCYGHLLPLMADNGSPKEEILEYGQKYRQLFPNGANAQKINSVLKPLEGN